MNYQLLKDCIGLLEKFEKATGDNLDFGADVSSFQRWICENFKSGPVSEPDWEGKENGRSPESVINTMIVHMNRYAKLYAKSAILGSKFSSQDEFIYLITLKSFGEMSKTELIRRNVQDKPAGIQIINRLIQKGLVEQRQSAIDLRSKIIAITEEGAEALENQMGKIRNASQLVTGNLTTKEKMEFIRLLNKLENFHHSLYSLNVPQEELLAVANDKIAQWQK